MQGFRRRLSRSMLSLPEANNYQALLQISRWAKGHKYGTELINDVGQPTPKSHPQLLREGEITPGITCDEYISRRRKLMEILPERSLAIFASAPVKMMTDVVPCTFRQYADYLYITGCTQPGGIAVLCKDHGLCMFMPDPDPNPTRGAAKATFAFYKCNTPGHKSTKCPKCKFVASATKAGLEADLDAAMHDPVDESTDEVVKASS